jgi:hypothetical protein
VSTTCPSSSADAHACGASTSPNRASSTAATIRVARPTPRESVRRGWARQGHQSRDRPLRLWQQRETHPRRLRQIGTVHLGYRSNGLSWSALLLWTNRRCCASPAGSHQDAFCAPRSRLVVDGDLSRRWTPRPGPVTVPGRDVAAPDQCVRVPRRADRRHDVKAGGGYVAGYSRSARMAVSRSGNAVGAVLPASPT